MASLQSRMFNLFVRNGHFFQGRLKKEVFNANTSIIEFRRRCEKGAEKFTKIPKDIVVKQQIIEEMNSEWLIPAGAQDQKVILYIHGGGYVSGSCSDHRGFVSKFASVTKLTTLHYEYRLAPEHPFPAALDDSIKMYQWLLTNYKPEHILLAGESAGGGLCLALLLALKQNELPLPAGAVAISPWTDLSCSGESYKTKNHLSPAPLNSWIVFSKHYAGNSSTSNPFMSPLFGDPTGLPPIFINSATDDELYDDGEQFYLKARKAGVDITFRKGSGMIHCYPLMAPLFPEATQAMEEIVCFIRSRLNFE
jgi:epsilon-lactone hydrolase